VALQGEHREKNTVGRQPSLAERGRRVSYEPANNVPRKWPREQSIEKGGRGIEG